MFIRTRAILVIVLTTSIIILFSVFAGIATTKRGIDISQEADLMLISDIADHFISGEIENLKLKAAEAAQSLAVADKAEWPDILANTEAYDFIGMAVMNPGGELAASAGEAPARAEIKNDRYVSQAFHGKKAFSSTIPTESHGVVFYLAVPIPGTYDNILVLTLPGTYLSKLLSSFVIWRTGHIFMDDAQGRLISNPRAQWVEDRADFMDRAEIDPSYEKLVSDFRQGLNSEARIIRYSISGVPRLCAYRPVSGSEEGWLLGVVAPLPESPFGDINGGLIVVGLVGFVLCVIAAIIASGFIKKPFDQITALKESAQVASRTKSSFLASMSHEIRTPMNAVIGMLELLTHESLNERQMSYVKDINHSATSLLSIINDILDMSKIESGKMELIPVDYDFFVFLDNMHSMFTYVAQEKGLEFKLETDACAPHYLFGDDIRLRQVIVNICGNAVKFTEKGYVRLKVINAGDTLIFEISDTGRGIRREDIGKLFSAFQQTDAEKNRAIAGTGLGLAICKSFVEMMGGAIAVESEYGEGTTFTVTVPLVMGDGDKIKAAAPKGKKLFAPKAKVLVVDDNEFNLKVAVGLLNLSKINVKTALSGALALEMVQQTDFDIVFMDHMMPEMDGVETTAAIRALGGKFKQTCIVALTANAVQGAREFFLSNGFNDFISKPIDVRELVSILKKWLPEDMLEEATEASDEPGGGDGEPSFLDILGGIEEINVKVGLNGAAGVESLYYETVELCCKRLPAECVQMSSSLAVGDVGLFAISVHAMKSILATIGAIGLSDKALALETAAKGDDVATCEKLFPDFHAGLLALHKQLLAAFPAKTASSKTSERAPGDAAILREGVEKALCAAQGYDNDAGVAAIEPLLAFDFGEETNALLEAAAHEFGEFDCEKAGETLGKVKKTQS
ncbi:MAG: ATP-binding protein [Synergistaceae bacterium]|nr:ATP-binding protein [Synergistaceae bacterium]